MWDWSRLLKATFTAVGQPFGRRELGGSVPTPLPHGRGHAAPEIGPARRTSRSVRRVLFPHVVTLAWATAIHLRRTLPHASSGLPGSSGGPPSNAPCLTLLQVGFTEPSQSPGPLVVSYTTVSPLPRRSRPRPERNGGLFSVALSRGSPRVGVTHHLALRSPDVPRWRTPKAHVNAAVRPTRPQVEPTCPTTTIRPANRQSSPSLPGLRGAGLATPKGTAARRYPEGHARCGNSGEKQ